MEDTGDIDLIVKLMKRGIKKKKRGGYWTVRVTDNTQMTKQMHSTERIHGVFVSNTDKQVKI